MAPEPSRITIGTDPSGMPRRPPETGRRRRGGPPPAPSRPSAGAPQQSGRDMPTAIAVGLVLAAAFGGAAEAWAADAEAGASVAAVAAMDAPAASEVEVAEEEAVDRLSGDRVVGLRPDTARRAAPFGDPLRSPEVRPPRR